LNVILLSISAKHEGARNHVNEEWVGNNRTHNFESRNRFGVQVLSVIFQDSPKQFLEVVGLRWEIIDDLLDKETEIVIEPEGSVGKFNYGIRCRQRSKSSAFSLSCRTTLGNGANLTPLGT
jgi:hypothetical protein